MMMGGGVGVRPPATTWGLSPMRMMMIICIVVVLLESCAVRAEEAAEEKPAAAAAEAKKKGAAAEGKRLKKSKKIERNPQQHWEPPTEPPPEEEPYEEDAEASASNIQGKPWDDEKVEYENMQRAKRQKEIDMWNHWFQYFINNPVISKEINKEDVTVTDEVKAALKVKGQQDGLLGQVQALGQIWDGFEVESSRIWKYGSVYYSTMRAFVPFSPIGQQEMIWKKCWALADEQMAHHKQATTETVTLKDMLDRYGETFEEGCEGWYKALSKMAEETANPRVSIPSFLQKVARHVDKLVELTQEYLSFKDKKQDKAEYTLGRLTKGVNVTRNALLVVEEEWQSLELWLAVHKAAIAAVEQERIKTMKEIRAALRKQCKDTGGCEPSKEFLAIDTIHLPGETVYPKMLKRLHRELRWLEKIVTKETEKYLRKPLKPPTKAQVKERKRALDAASAGEDPSTPMDGTSDAKCDAPPPPQDFSQEGMAAAHEAAHADAKPDIPNTMLRKGPRVTEEAKTESKEGKPSTKKGGKKAKKEKEAAETKSEAAEAKPAEVKTAEGEAEGKEEKDEGW